MAVHSAKDYRHQIFYITSWLIQLPTKEILRFRLYDIFPLFITTALISEMGQ